MQIQNFPLNTLRMAKTNSRKTKPDPAAIAELAASLLAPHALIKPLVVRLDGVGGAQIIDGGLRFSAFKLNAEAGHIEADHPVPCRIYELVGDIVLEECEISLAANVHQVPLHPADQALAFTKLHDTGRGLSVELIAAPVRLRRAHRSTAAPSRLSRRPDPESLPDREDRPENRLGVHPDEQQKRADGVVDRT